MTLRGTFVASLACVCLALPAFACINTVDKETSAKLDAADATGLVTILAELEKKHAARPTLESGNDLAVARILTGKYPEAIALLRETDQKFPGNARVAANLGTALELSGNDVEALDWIREGVKRAADELHRSEWLHARVLEAKIALAKDPQWLEKNRVLALDFGTADVPVVPEILPITKEGRLRGGDDLVEDIGYQLAERAKFVKPPDAVLGDLAASLGDLLYAGFDADPRQSYEMALSNGAPRADLIRARIKRYVADHPKPATYVKPAPNAVKATQEEPKEKRPEIRPSSLIRIVWPVAALTVALGVVGWFVRKRRRAADAVERALAAERSLAARTQGAAGQDTRTISS